MSLAERSGRYLSFTEREEIAILRAQGHGPREIGRRIGRDASTISRELRRNAATRSTNPGYRASTAQWKAEIAARRPKQAKLAQNLRLREYVQNRRADRSWSTAWSPEQIAHRLRIDFPDDESMRISHEAIYQALYIQGRGALKRELVACLRTGRALRVPRARSRNKATGHVTADVVLSQRPAEVEDRAIPGNWEGDLITCREQMATEPSSGRRMARRWPATARSR